MDEKSKKIGIFENLNKKSNLLFATLVTRVLKQNIEFPKGDCHLTILCQPSDSRRQALEMRHSMNTTVQMKATLQRSMKKLILTVMMRMMRLI